MRETKKGSIKTEAVLVDLKELRNVLGCGRSSAEQIAKASEASVRVGRRHLYNIKKIQEFVDSIAE